METLKIGSNASNAAFFRRMSRERPYSRDNDQDALSYMRMDGHLKQIELVVQNEGSEADQLRLHGRQQTTAYRQPRAADDTVRRSREISVNVFGSGDLKVRQVHTELSELLEPGRVIGQIQHCSSVASIRRLQEKLLRAREDIMRMTDMQVQELDQPQSDINDGTELISQAPRSDIISQGGLRSQTKSEGPVGAVRRPRTQ
jgi:hypothetical protein